MLPYEAILGMATSVVLLLLTVVLAMRRPLRKHNVACGFLFTFGIVYSSSYVIKLHKASENIDCKSDSLSYYSFFLMRLTVMTIYYLRIDTLIGERLFYPAWLRWLCIPIVSSSFVSPTIMRILLGSDINCCSNNFVYLLIFTRIVPSFVFLLIFFAPLCRYIDPQLQSVIRKQGLFFVFDVCIEFAFLVTVADWGNRRNYLRIDAWSMILQQIFLVFMFKDAKLFYCPCLFFVDKEQNISMDEYSAEYHCSPVSGSPPGKNSFHESLLEIRPEENSYQEATRLECSNCSQVSVF